MRTHARTRTLLAVATGGWVSIALLDLWAGVDVLTASDRSADSSPIVDHLGNDSVVATTHLAQPDLIALVIGLLVIAAAVGLYWSAGEAVRSRLGRLLGALALVSVITLARGGHAYALLIPICLLVGAGGKLARRRPTGQHAPRPTPRAPRPRPLPASPAPRPSPRPRVVAR
jgi:hypothetical protein